MTKPETLGARIRARNPQRIANNPWTTRDRTGLRAGYSPATGGSADSAARLKETKLTGDQSEVVSYEEAKEALGWS